MSSVGVAAPDAQAIGRALGTAATALDDLTGPSADAAADVLGVVRAPVRTGRLASTVAAVPGPVGFTLTAGGRTAPYGPAVHARTPFLTDALHARQRAVTDRYTDHLTDVVDHITT